VPAHNWPGEINAIWQAEGDHWELPADVVPLLEMHGAGVD